MHDQQLRLTFPLFILCEFVQDGSCHSSAGRACDSPAVPPLPRLWRYLEPRLIKVAEGTGALEHREGTLSCGAEM